MTTGWKKTATGYEIATKLGTASVAKVGKVWILTLGERSLELGRRASFDHAEGTLREWGAL